MKLFIRADGNQKIALGHIMRCLSIADAVKEKGGKVFFCLADESPAALIKKRGFEAHILRSDFEDMEEELPKMSRMIRSERPDMVLVDSYYATPKYMAELRKLVPVAFMDDMAEMKVDADIIINYNNYAPKLSYAASYAKRRAFAPRYFLLGSEYAPLRKEFRSIHMPFRENVENVLITTGGGDLFHVMISLLHHIMEAKEENPIQSLQYHAICGPFFKDMEELEELREAFPNIHIHENVSNMADIMKECDLAISATGSTMYELCAVGLPTIAFYFAKNQQQMAECFAKDINMMNAGFFPERRGIVMQNIIQEIAFLTKHPNERKKLSDDMRRYVDGKGAFRIAEALIRGV